MKKLLVFFCILFLASPLSIGQGVLEIRLAISGQQLATANANPDPTRASPGRLGVTQAGEIIFTDFSSPNNEIFVANVSVSSPDITKLTDTDTLKAKVNEANGPDPAPTAMTIQAVDEDADGHIVVLTDGRDPETAYLFSLDRQTKTITLLTGLDHPFLPVSPVSSIEGASSMAVMGMTAYITLDEFFQAFNGDSIAKIDVHSPDGGKTAASQLISTPQLEMEIGMGQNIALNDIAVRPSKGTLVVINSGAAAANDDILEVDPITGSVSTLVAATDVESDLKTTDVGFRGIDVGPSDVIYLSNHFGTNGEPPHRGIITVANPGSKRGDAAIFVSQAQIASSPNIRSVSGATITSVSYQNAGLAVSPKTGEVFFTESNTSGVIGVRRQ